MMKVTKQEVRKMVEAIFLTLDNQPSATPCIYCFDGEISLSHGSTMFGTAEPVYNKVAEIVVDTETLKEYRNEYQVGLCNKQEVVDSMYDRIQDFISDYQELEVNKGC